MGMKFQTLLQEPSFLEKILSDTNRECAEGKEPLSLLSTVGPPAATILLRDSVPLATVDWTTVDS